MVSGDLLVEARRRAGISQAELSRRSGVPASLIGRYERYEDKHAGKIIGTGLGLAITRQIVEMHGGRVSVDSVVGHGSEFRFTVPLAENQEVVTRSA